MLANAVQLGSITNQLQYLLEVLHLSCGRFGRAQLIKVIEDLQTDLLLMTSMSSAEGERQRLAAWKSYIQLFPFEDDEAIWESGYAELPPRLDRLTETDRERSIDDAFEETYRRIRRDQANLAGPLRTLLLPTDEVQRAYFLGQQIDKLVRPSTRPIRLFQVTVHPDFRRPYPVRARREARRRGAWSLPGADVPQFIVALKEPGLVNPPKAVTLEIVAIWTLLGIPSKLPIWLPDLVRRQCLLSLPVIRRQLLDAACRGLRERLVSQPTQEQSRESGNESSSQLSENISNSESGAAHTDVAGDQVETSAIADEQEITSTSSEGAVGGANKLDPSADSPKRDDDKWLGLNLDKERRILRRKGFAEVADLNGSELFCPVIELALEHSDLFITNDQVDAIFRKCRGVKRSPGKGVINNLFCGINKELRKINVHFKPKYGRGRMLIDGVRDLPKSDRRKKKSAVKKVGSGR